MKTILSSMRHHYVRMVSIFLIMLTMVTLIPGMVGCGSRTPLNAIPIRTWYDLAAVGNNMSANYILENDLDASTDGWDELASPTTNGGRGWKPIVGVNESQPLWFTGVFDGQGHKIKDLFINRTDEEGVGLFSWIHMWGGIRNVGLMNATVIGGEVVGGLVGQVGLRSTVSNSNFTGTVTGSSGVGGLVGEIWEGGSVSSCYCTGGVTGNGSVGGLVGYISESTVTGSYSTSSVTGRWSVGGLVGWSRGNVTGSYATGSVTGDNEVGGLVGNNDGDVSDSYSTGSVTGDERVGGLVGGIHSDLISYFGDVTASYATGDVTGNVDVGGLVGENEGIVSNSYSTGSVNGTGWVGGLVGDNWLGDVSDSYSTGSVTGDERVGGLVGWMSGFAENSHYDYEEVLINSDNIITFGALFHDDFEEWLANDKSLDVNERLSQESGYYVLNNVSDFKQLLAFGQNGSLKFRLKSDLDLGSDPNFYIPYLAGQFDGNGYKISNLSFNFDFIWEVGLFGHVGNQGNVSNVGVENVNITACNRVGGLVGWNEGTVSGSYCTGSVTGDEDVGGLVGSNDNTFFARAVMDSYSTANVSGFSHVGGLMGLNYESLTNCYSRGKVTGNSSVGGLVGYGAWNLVSNSFWDTETSGLNVSEGGTGKTTAEMKDFDTFSGATWNITTVANPGLRNLLYIWNVVDDLTYPFLSWQP